MPFRVFFLGGPPGMAPSDHRLIGAAIAISDLGYLGLFAIFVTVLRGGGGGGEVGAPQGGVGVYGPSSESNPLV